MDQYTIVVDKIPLHELHPQQDDREMHPMKMERDEVVEIVIVLQH
jgi:hypothetical protein